MFQLKFTRHHVPMLLIFFVVLIDTMSWAMVIPILPTYALRFHADELTIGLLLSTYSFTQLLAAPWLGLWSDRVGRKPVLVYSMLGTSLAALLTGLASSAVGIGLMVLFVARALDGITGANIATAQSYVADITEPENRAQGMGMVGAAIGLGYTFGPAFSGIIARHFGVATPFFVAAALAFSNMTAMWLLLPEVRTPKEPGSPSEHSSSRFANILEAFHNPQLNSLLLVSFLMTVASILYMSMLPLFTKVQIHFAEEKNAYLFAYMGFTTTMVQGGLIRPLVKRFGEAPVLLAGLIVLGSSMTLLTLAHMNFGLYVFTGGLAIGTALVTPTALGLISRRTPASQQGKIMGVSSSVSSFGRILGPAWGGFSFKHFGPHAPFYSGSVACLAGVLILGLFGLRSAEAMKSEEGETVKAGG